MQIAPYVPGKSKTDDGRSVVKLSSNENPFGTADSVREAFRSATDCLERYPDSAAPELREAIAAHYGLDADRVIYGTGSDEVLHMAAGTFAGPGDEIIFSRYGFSVYPIATRRVGAVPVEVADKDYATDVDAILAGVTERTRVVFLANPNNPTGTYLDGAELRRLHAGLRPDILLVVDSAYAEYVTAADYTVGIDLVDAAENVVMVRTFSKMGIAGERVGWMYGPAHVVDAINRIRGPFNVTLSGQAAAAAAARDVAFTAELRAHNARWRDWLSGALAGNAIQVPPSQGNFVLALFADAETARAAFTALRDMGLLVREMHSYGIANGLRISIGLEPHMRAVVEVLRAFGAPGAKE